MHSLITRTFRPKFKSLAFVVLKTAIRILFFSRCIPLLGRLREPVQSGLVMQNSFGLEGEAIFWYFRVTLEKRTNSYGIFLTKEWKKSIALECIDV